MRLSKIIKNSIKYFLNLHGYQIYKRYHSHIGRHTLEGGLHHIKRLGFKPEVVIDVGAATGTWPLYEAFPDARHILIEPLKEFEECLKRVISKLKNADYIIAAAAKTAGSSVINIHPDFFGSSFYLECEDSDVNGAPRTVPAVTLDGICKERALRGPFLIKIDTQGAELDVLSGATQALNETEYLVLEVSLFSPFAEGAQLYDIVSFMRARGFTAYDILDYQYRPLDGAMSQVDIVFVKESSQFRKHCFYATKEQRRAQDRMLSKSLDEEPFQL